MWKILTAQIKEEINSEKQKGYYKRNRGTGELLYIEQRIVNVGKMRRKDLAMPWIDHKGLRYGLPKLDITLYQNV